VVEVKFCGLTRAEDVREAGRLGARWVGAILTDSPRRLTAARAREVLAGAPEGTGRVAVFGADTPARIGVTATDADVDVVQLHGDPDAAFIAELRRAWNGTVWAVVRVAGSELPQRALELFDVADAVVLDARVEGRLGGTGQTIAWSALAAPLSARRGKPARLALAGGLDAGNVARAIAALHPDIVDVSSGVESSVGVKDHARMRAFRDAALGTR